MYHFGPIFRFCKIKENILWVKKQDNRVLLCIALEKKKLLTENRNVTGSEIYILSKVSHCIGGKWGNQADEQ